MGLLRFTNERRLRDLLNRHPKRAAHIGNTHRQSNKCNYSNTKSFVNTPRCPLFIPIQAHEQPEVAASSSAPSVIFRLPVAGVSNIREVDIRTKLYQQ